MAVLIVLFGAWIALRAAGAFGVHALDGWAASAPFALGAMFLFTGIAHFNKMKYDRARMVPSAFPQPLMVIYATGVLEWLGAVGLALPATRRAAALGLILLLIALFPANVKAAREDLTLGGRRATPLWLRLPMQLLFIGLLWWSCVDY